MNPIVKYFNGEKQESYLFIIIGVIALVMALYFFFVLKSSFWKGVAIPFIVVAVLEFTVGYSIIIRSPKDIIRVENLVKKEPQQIRTYEIPRMEKVMKNFVIFRFIEIGFLFLGIILMYRLPVENFSKGIGLGLFIQASIVLLLDFFAESRGFIYLDYLKKIVDRL